MPTNPQQSGSVVHRPTSIIHELWPKERLTNVSSKKALANEPSSPDENYDFPDFDTQSEVKRNDRCIRRNVGRYY
jgi:hypothetical protein